MGASHLNQSKPVEAYIMLLHLVSEKKQGLLRCQRYCFGINGKWLMQYELQHISTEGY